MDNTLLIVLLCLFIASSAFTGFHNKPKEPDKREPEIPRPITRLPDGRIYETFDDGSTRFVRREK